MSVNIYDGEKLVKLAGSGGGGGSSPEIEAKLAELESLIEQTQALRADLENYGMVKLSNSSAVTENVGLALPATEKNPNIEGSLANELSKLSDIPLPKVFKVYRYQQYGYDWTRFVPIALYPIDDSLTGNTALLFGLKGNVYDLSYYPSSLDEFNMELLDNDLFGNGAVVYKLRPLFAVDGLLAEYSTSIRAVTTLINPNTHDISKIDLEAMLDTDSNKTILGISDMSDTVQYKAEFANAAFNSLGITIDTFT